MRFTKMHGAGNDYVFVDAFEQEVPADLAATARRISDRRCGVGADGLIVLEPDSEATFRMRIFNADGSEAELCGNGLRCAFRLLQRHGRFEGDRAVARTGAGLIALEAAADGDAVAVDMGRPVVGDPIEIEARDRRFTAHPVSLGNPHAVVFLDEEHDELASFPVERFGSAIECHPHFPERTNVEFARCGAESVVAQRTWERGSGETQACGTGACATVVAGLSTGRLTASPRPPNAEPGVLVQLRGGDLWISWKGPGRSLRMVGPAEPVFTGEWPT